MKAPELKLLDPLTGDMSGERPKGETQPAYAFILSLQRGEPEAIRTLYWEHHAALRALGRHLLGNPNDAEDLLHEVFLAVPRALNNYRGESSLRTFLIAITVKRAGKALRALKRYRRILGFLQIPGQTPQGDDRQPEHTIERRELSAALAKELNRLPFRQRAVVVLCLVEERSAGEVAQILGISEATVRTRLFYGRRLLRTRLRRHR
jgi:RNA polymerase sigma-70 factor (ECF subfamily)